MDSVRMTTTARADSESAAFLSAIDMHNAQIAAAISMLCLQWELGLKMPEANRLESPRDRQEKMDKPEARCFAKIKFLQYKNGLSPATNRFLEEADIMSKSCGWVRKPKGEHGLPPRTRAVMRPTTDDQRGKLLDLLERILDDERKKFPNTPSFNRQIEGLNDAPIPSIHLPKSNRKRSSDDHFDDVQASTKKQRQPQPTENLQSEVASMTTSMAPPQTRSRIQEVCQETSFISNASTVFTTPSIRNFDLNVTQTTIPDEDDYESTQPNFQYSSPKAGHPKSSNYGSMDETFLESFDGNNHLIDGSNTSSGPSFDQENAEEESQIYVLADEEMLQDLNGAALDILAKDPAAQDLYGRLGNVFPKLNPTLEKLPFAALYEITRVCLFNAVPMEKFILNPSSVLDNVHDYDSLWSLLESHPLLKGKPFPPRSSREAWVATTADFKKGDRAVVFSGNLSYAIDSTQPFFQFRLDPLRFDGSYRLGRRHGHDRFLEMDFPQMSGRKAPVVLQKLGHEAQVLLVSWLVDGSHHLFGRTWKPFHMKPKERRGRKVENKGDEEFDTAHRLFFFAVDGHDFQTISSPYNTAHEKMSISTMLDSIRPISENGNGSYLKLFARTDLAVSKNTPTVILNKSYNPERSQVLFKDDITCNGEVMTDGAGQISYKLAQEVTQQLGLSFVPSGFQARIGEAKGFWSVDYQDKSGEAWISVYGSQRKWNLVPGEGSEANHTSHRTFEVLRYSAPLKAADLNLQLLPLLQDRAINSQLMTRALKNLLREGLQRQLDDLQKALTDPQAFRVWLREAMASSGDRLKSECVQYRCGLPISIDEKLNLFLDAGFDPSNLNYLKELARKAFMAKCEELKKRLNITVSKSTYVYMRPDFAGVLEANEVYLDFSGFTDESSGFINASVLLNGVDILVARSPAHYVSDIQKVRAVHKVELMGLKDVIVFSVKGNPSLAAKLSGGDYDGDIAWVCWEPAIVDNFQNADVPEAPDLVKEGLIKQNKVTYKELVEGSHTPTSTFLNASLLFNMQPKMLGICTSFKESLCYTMGSVNSKEAVYLSTLLSSLVDQAKQGYIFTDEDWDYFRSTVIRRSVQVPSYKKGPVSPRSKHIIDQLVIEADRTIKLLLTNFQKNTKKAPQFDPDLVICYESALKKSREDYELKKENSAWHRLIKDLNTDLKQMMGNWSKTMSMKDDDSAAAEYLLKVDNIYKEFINIKPHFNSYLTDILLPDGLKDLESSEWAFLRASALFANFRSKPVPNYIWSIAAFQICYLKTRYSGTRAAHPVVPSMYAMLKPDAAYVKRARTQRTVGVEVFDENLSVVNADELEDLED